MTKNLKTNNLPYLFKNHFWLLLVLCCFFFSLFAQDKGFVVPDSLKNKDLKELEDGYFKNNKNFKIAEIYAKTILVNGKKDKNNKIIAKAYRHLSNLNDGKGLELNYLDSIIILKFKKENLIYKAAALFTKAAYFDEKHKYKEAFENYNVALKIANNEDKLFLVHDIKQNIGVLKNKIGKYKEALNIFKDCYLYNQKNNIKDNYQHLITLHNLSISYQKNNLLDTATFLNKKGYLESKKIDNNFKKYFIFNQGVILYKKNNFRLSIDSILKVIPKFNNQNNLNTLGLAYFYLGKSYFNKKDEKTGVNYLIKMDSIIQIHQNMLIDERDGYTTLIKYFKKNRKHKKQLIYTEKLLKFDSIINSNLLNINNSLILKFETPNLIKEKEALIKHLNKKIKNNFYLFLPLLLISIFIGLIYFKKQLTFKKRFNKLNLEIEQNEFGNKKEIPVVKAVFLTIKANPILKQLEEFEKERGFLEIKLTQTNLAKKLNTNSTYLSKVINQYKNTNFSTYINNLRVDYAIKKLKDDRKLFLLTIDGMSNEFGFNNSETFSKAFYKKTGIYPSYFIKQLKTNNK